MRSISMDEALSVLLNTFKHAKKMDAHALGAIVLDPGGRVKAFLKQDGASLLRYEIAHGKAFASLALHRSSRMVLQKAREKPHFMEAMRELSPGPIFPEGGGQLIRDPNGDIIGAIGVTGDVNDVDDICAIEGIRASGFKSDDDFSTEDCKRFNIKKGPPIKDPR